jgi:hypothetical protein
MDTSNPNTIQMLMAEVAANVEAIVEHALQNVAQPPRGSIKEIGHYKALNERFKRKEYEALEQLLEEVAYNVASTIFATIDGSVESDFEDFPDLAVTIKGSSLPITDSLYEAFTAMWEEEGDEEPYPHPD